MLDMRYITLSGVDGSGKSTQLELLKQHLISAGHRVAYFHAVEFSLVNRLVRRLKHIKNFQPGHEKAITRTSLFALLLRQTFFFLDVFRFRRFYATLKQEGYDYLLSDRSFFDSFIQLEYLALQHKNALPFLLWRTHSNVLESSLPRPDIAFYFELDPQIIMSRERIPEQGIEYLETKQDLYQTKIRPWNMHVLNTDQPKELVFASLLATFREH